MNKSRMRVVSFVGLSVLAAGYAGLAGGCYERVVGAHGLGSERIETQERYQQDTEVDRWFYGTGDSSQAK